MKCSLPVCDLKCRPDGTRLDAKDPWPIEKAAAEKIAGLLLHLNPAELQRSIDLHLHSVVRVQATRKETPR
jgi:hypothetical protein